MPNLRDELNPPQYEAATHQGSPLLILAGAGSGKTRVLIYRILHLTTAAGVAPGNVLAVTFTNKAAGEMRERLVRAIGWDRARQAWMHTFHGACLRILRQEIGGRISPYTGSFVIYDQDAQRSLVKKAMAACDISDKVFPARAVLSRIHEAKNRLIGPKQFGKGSSAFADDVVGRVYLEYQQLLRMSNAVDFDDILGLTVQLFQEHPEVLEYYQDKFRHILVDEYQDTNPAQYRLVSMLAERHGNLAVVGDDDQSIYRFRGADVQNILDFERDFPNTKVIRLEQNYRSTQTILSAASAVVARNRDRLGKTLWTQGEQGELVDLYEARDEREEGQWIAGQVANNISKGGISARHIAVFYRTNAQSRALEEGLRARGLSYRIVGALKFFDRAEIRDVLAYVRIAVNPADTASIARVVGRPSRGIGASTLEKLEVFARSRGIALGEAFLQADEVPGLSGAAAKKAKMFGATLRTLAEAAKTDKPSPFLRRIVEETGYLEWLSKGGAGPEEDPSARLENIAQLIQTAAEYSIEETDAGVAQFLDAVSLVSDQDDYKEAQETVTLMTLHCAKGLEFPIVFIAGIEEGIFPHNRSIEEGPAGIEEERRLLYVGMTRAMKRLTLSFARDRAIIGPRRPATPSRFLSEIPSALLRIVQSRSTRGVATPALISDPGFDFEQSRSWKPRPVQARAPEVDPYAHDIPPDDFYEGPTYDGDEPASNGGAFRVGQKVKHPQFGEGIVVELRGASANPKLSIRFAGQGVRTVLARFANLQRV